ncbi:MAG: DUF418 domain-containing protein [Devosiaceae bacterium]|nr:DUF418 domain-containing protein [Devosiaceae bacterium]
MQHNNSVKSGKSTRLHGLDLARFLAFAGMVFVNFKVVMGAETGAIWAQYFLGFLEGKAAATFVILAGIGLGIGAARNTSSSFNLVILKRAGFLFVIGMLNALIFPADILHYYALYFVFGLLLIRQSVKVIASVALVFPFIFLLLTAIFDYEQGWNWITLDYAGFWSFEGFFRNLLFNGFHPLVPWMSFLLLGFILARLKLAEKRTHNMLMLTGAIALGLAYVLSDFLSGLDPEMAEISGVAPMPPMPLYMLAGSGAGVLLIGICLAVLSGRVFAGEVPAWLQIFITTGRQALSLYIFHIFIGMGILEAFGLLGGQNSQIAVFAAGLFIIASIIYATVWARYFKGGPFELLMRRMTG